MARTLSPSALSEYRRKRDFKKTTEPGASGRSARGRSFVVQKHEATGLHYDLRLELDGVHKSWAVPKGPSLDPGIKRAAIRVEDHPVAYGDFEGVIPYGLYGGGTVMVWDRGVWEPLDEDPAQALLKGKLSFRLRGEKLHGEWTLIRTHRSHERGESKTWLLIKKPDADAIAGDVVTARLPLSVKTGRDLNAIAKAGGQKRKVRSDPAVTERGSKRGFKSRPAPPAPRRATASRRASGGSRESWVDPAGVSGSTAMPMPPGVEPQLCRAVDTAPTGDQWVHEIKYDGYRILAYISDGKVTLMSRNGLDWTARFRKIAEGLGALPLRSAIIDGEACAVDATGRTAFQSLQQALKSEGAARLLFFAFDLLYLDGYSLMQARLVDRKALLERLLKGSGENIRFSAHVAGDGPELQCNACRLALEGIVSKQADSPYLPASRGPWVKSKCGLRQEFVVVGYTTPGGTRSHFGSLLLAAHDGDGHLIYTGHVGTGFSEVQLADLKSRLSRWERTRHPLHAPAAPEEVRGAHWVEPRMVVEVTFSEWTDDGRLRHPSFQGIREDKDPSEVRIERPNERVIMRRRSSPSRAAAPKTPKPKAEAGSVAGITISHPERMVYPELGISKLQVARYYESVAPLMMPFVKNRPLSTVRCPGGASAKCFFQKHVGETFSEPVHSIAIKQSQGVENHITIDSTQGLVKLVQLGVLEIHPWGSRNADIERPDMLTFDFDPGPDVDFEAVKIGSIELRTILTDLDLQAFVKTSGGKGLHVVIPLQPRADWESAKRFTAGIAEQMAAAEPSRYVSTMTKRVRKGKVFIDYFRNGRGATSVAAYSTRARAGAGISLPIEWDDLVRLRAADQFTLLNVQDHLAKRKRDPWRDFFKLRQVLTLARLKSAGPSA